MKGLCGAFLPAVLALVPAFGSADWSSPQAHGTRAALESGSECREIVPDAEYRCPYRPLDPMKHNVTFIRGAENDTRAGDIGRPESTQSDPVFESLGPFGWGTTGPASFAPDLQRALVPRLKPGCPPYQGQPDPAALACSYGRITLWLAYHAVNDPARPDDDEWVHLNLARRGLGRNSEAHGWSTWPHRDLALFNALVFPDDGGWVAQQDENAAQVYSVSLRSNTDFTVSPFAPDFLWRGDCLTGRIMAQPPRQPDRCFDGQRVSLVRRCYSEPKTPASWAWWNTRSADGTGGTCIPAGQDQVPVLRTYVMELDARCRPKKSFSNMVPVQEPESGPFHQMMGLVPEWGDMLSSISPDGRFVALGTNTADPGGDPNDHCGGFKVSLADTTNPMNGMALRWTRVCELDSSLRCSSPPTPIGVERTPPEGTPLPSFVHLPAPDGFQRKLVYVRAWGVFGQPRGNDVMSLDLDQGPDARVPLSFASTGSDAIFPIYWVPPPAGQDSRLSRCTSDADCGRGFSCWNRLPKGPMAGIKGSKEKPGTCRDNVIIRSIY